jgi:hypothetical protein
LSINCVTPKAIELQKIEIFILQGMLLEIYSQITAPTFWKDLDCERKQFWKIFGGINFYSRKMIYDLEAEETYIYKLMIMKKYEKLLLNALPKGIQFIVEHDRMTSELETLVGCDYSEIQALQEKINLYFTSND